MTNKNYKIKFTITLIILVLISIISLNLGRYDLNLSDIIEVIFSPFTGSKPPDTNWQVIVNLRLPRLLGAILIGASLSISGASYQSVFKNQLVAPDLLGVSSGASVGAMVAIFMGLDRLWIQLFAFIGGLIAVNLSVFISKIVGRSTTTILILSGIIVGGLMNSFMDLIKYMADPDEELASIVYWQMGSLTKVQMGDISTIFPLIIICTGVLILLSWRMNVLSLGDKEAKMLGVNVQIIRNIVIVCATLLCASSVALAGTIGWIGLVVPHLARFLVGQDNTKSMPVCLMIGSIFLLLSFTNRYYCKIHYLC